MTDSEKPKDVAISDPIEIPPASGRLVPLTVRVDEDGDVLITQLRWTIFIECDDVPLLIAAIKRCAKQAKKMKSKAP